jgi:hypothetical protein
MQDVMECFRPGSGSLLSALVGRRINRILVAATKADHLHHEGHDRLEAITRRLVDRAVTRAGLAGAGIDVMAIASIRATKEATVKQDGETLPVIVGTPMAGETINGEVFDGNRTTAVFPGDLPAHPEAIFTQDAASMPHVNALRFRPPEIPVVNGERVALPHIRLDRALQFLLGDRLQ